MSFHYGQRVDVRVDGAWVSGTVDAEGSDGQLSVLLDYGDAIWVVPFYVRPRWSSLARRNVLNFDEEPAKTAAPPAMSGMEGP